MSNEKGKQPLNIILKQSLASKRHERLHLSADRVIIVLWLVVYTVRYNFLSLRIVNF